MSTQHTVIVVDRDAPADVSPLAEQIVPGGTARDAVRAVVDELIADYTLALAYVDHADGCATAFVVQRSDWTVVGVLDVTVETS